MKSLRLIRPYSQKKSRAIAHGMVFAIKAVAGIGLVFALRKLGLYACQGSMDGLSLEAFHEKLP